MTASGRSVTLCDRCRPSSAKKAGSLCHQGEGSITDDVVRRLLQLQGLMDPHQIITLMTYAGHDNTLALPDHANHVHVGFKPIAG